MNLATESKAYNGKKPKYDVLVDFTWDSESNDMLEMNCRGLHPGRLAFAEPKEKDFLEIISKLPKAGIWQVCVLGEYEAGYCWTLLAANRFPSFGDSIYWRKE